MIKGFWRMVATNVRLAYQHCELNIVLALGVSYCRWLMASDCRSVIREVLSKVRIFYHRHLETKCLWTIQKHCTNRVPLQFRLILGNQSKNVFVLMTGCIWTLKRTRTCLQCCRWGWTFATLSKRWSTVLQTVSNSSSLSCEFFVVWTLVQGLRKSIVTFLSSHRDRGVGGGGGAGGHVGPPPNIFKIMKY